MYDLKQLMMMVNMPERTIRRHLKLGVLKGKKIGGVWRFTETDVLNYIQEDSIKKSMDKQTLNIIIDTYYGVKGSDPLIIIPIKKTTKLALSKLSLEVSTYASPFTFDVKPSGDKHIITFKGTKEDTAKLLDYVKNHFEEA